MDIRWTALSTYPDRLYRVFYSFQATNTHSHSGVAAPDRSTKYFEDDMPGFIASLISHRRQDRKLSPYISFFEDLQEAQMWCLAAEDTFGIPCGVMSLDLRSRAFQQGMAGGTITGFRLGDVVKKLRLKEPWLGKPSGEGRMDSEWLFVYRLPPGAFFKNAMTGHEIRQWYNWPQVPRQVTCRCECREAREGRQHVCTDVPLVRVKGGGALSCGCRSESLCIHFDWRLDDVDLD